MKQNKTISLNFFVFMAVVIAAEMITLPIPANAQHDPSQFETMTVVRVVLQPKGEYDIAVTPEEYRIGLIKLLREKGFNALGGENIVFNKDKSDEARFLLGGTIENIECKAAGGSTHPCEITVIWELLDRDIDEVRYKVRTRYFHHIDFNQIEKDFPKMIGGSMLSVLEREKFIATIKKGAELKETEQTFPATDIKRCGTGVNPLPKGLSKSFDAAVLIKNGKSIGSGFFISPDGFIVTAAHVVAGTSTVKIKTHDEKELEAVVLRKNRHHDVALLKIEGPSPRCFSTGSSIDIGEDIYSIGAPASEELAFSVSKGVVSGKRDFEGRAFIQTDTSLNPGNSGGPLIDLKGRVVAVVSWKLAIPGFEGIAFGVPIEHALSILSVSVGEETTVATSEVARAKSGGVKPESVMFEDAEDPSRFEALDKEQKKQTEDRLAQAARIQEVRDEANRRMEAEHKVKRAAHRKKAKSVMQKIWFVSSVLLGVGGGGMVAGTYAKFKTSEPSMNEFDTLKNINTVGWVLGGVGLGSIGLFYITGHRLSAETEGNDQAAENLRPSFGVAVAPNGFVLEGSF